MALEESSGDHQSHKTFLPEPVLQLVVLKAGRTKTECFGRVQIQKVENNGGQYGF